MSKSQLAVELSKLKVFNTPKLNLEQYPTDSEIAAEVLWNAFMSNDIKEKIIADFGCGSGILGIGALFLGAKFVYFIDKDKDVLKILKDNLDDFEYDNYKIINSEIDQLNNEVFSNSVDTILQNPPFGTKEIHADKLFLESAIKFGKIIYSFHKTNTFSFIKAFSNDNNLTILESWKFAFPIKKSFEHHKKKIERIDVSCYKLKVDKH